MIGFCPLGSGSKGNALYFGTEKTKLLIDAGLSTKQITLRLKELSVGIDEIDAIIITHEHNDHIAGLKVLNQKMGIPIFCNRETAKGIYRNLGFMPQCKIFSTGESFFFRDLEVSTFSVQHDTLDPIGLTIKVGDKMVGICTDLGFVTSIVKSKLMGCDLLYVEANHHPPLVEECKRPQVYKQRVLGRQGHLSNLACAELIDALHHDKLKRVYLAHLSSECNKEELALETVAGYLRERQKELDIKIAYQEKRSEEHLF